MTTLVFDVNAFRERFPAFTSPIALSDASLQGYWDTAICYISDADYGYLSGNQRSLAINLMTAHLAAISEMIGRGQSPALETASSVDKVSVTLTPPPIKSQWQWWLSTTPYGSQLLALLQAKSVGGFYVGGIPERAAFRKSYGVF